MRPQPAVNTELSRSRTPSRRVLCIDPSSDGTWAPLPGIWFAGEKLQPRSFSCSEILRNIGLLGEDSLQGMPLTNIFPSTPYAQNLTRYKFCSRRYCTLPSTTSPRLGFLGSPLLSLFSVAGLTALSEACNDVSGRRSTTRIFPGHSGPPPFVCVLVAPRLLPEQLVQIVSLARILTLLLFALQLSLAVGYTYGDEDAFNELTLTTCSCSHTQSANQRGSALNRPSRTVVRHPGTALGVVFQSGGGSRRGTVGQ